MPEQVKLAEVPLLDKLSVLDRDELQGHIDSLNTISSASYGLRCASSAVEALVRPYDEHGALAEKVRDANEALMALEDLVMTLNVALVNIKRGACPSCMHDITLHQDGGCQDRTLTKQSVPQSWGPCPCTTTFPKGWWDG